MMLNRKLASANQAPKRGEKTDTHVSHRFQQFLDNKKCAEERRKKKRSTEEDEEFPHLKQKVNESDRNYLQRLDQVRCSS